MKHALVLVLPGEPLDNKLCVFVYPCICTAGRRYNKTYKKSTNSKAHISLANVCVRRMCVGMSACCCFSKNQRKRKKTLPKSRLTFHGFARRKAKANSQRNLIFKKCN